MESPFSNKIPVLRVCVLWYQLSILHVSFDKIGFVTNRWKMMALSQIYIPHATDSLYCVADLSLGGRLSIFLRRTELCTNWWLDFIPHTDRSVTVSCFMEYTWVIIAADSQSCIYTTNPLEHMTERANQRVSHWESKFYHIGRHFIFTFVFLLLPEYCRSSRVKMGHAKKKCLVGTREILLGGSSANARQDLLTEHSRPFSMVFCSLFFACTYTSWNGSDFNSIFQVNLKTVSWGLLGPWPTWTADIFEIRF